MRKIYALIFILTASVILINCKTDSGSEILKKELSGLDAVKAVELANQWSRSKVKVKSFVDAESVNFEFEDGTIKKISLPSDKFYVAIAPYLTYTHT